MKSKKKQNTNKVHDALVERDRGSPHRMTAGSLHWLQNKDRVVLNHYGFHLHDHVLMENVFLDDRNEITTKRLHFLCLSLNTRMQNRFSKKQYQNEKEGRAQFEVVGELDEISREAGKFIKWSDILDTALDSTELCEAANLSDKFVICHWNVLHNKFRRR